MMREVRRVELVGLVRELLRGSRRHDGDALGRELRDRVEREVGGRLDALDARELSALTRVENDERERARGLTELLAERCDGQLFASESERAGERVSRVIEDEH